MAGGISSRRRRVERIQGVAFDAILIAVAAAISEDAVQAWLFDNPAALYHGLAVLHLIACPAVLVAIVAGYGKSDVMMKERGAPGERLLVWAFVFVLCGSFVIPSVLALILHIELWEMMLTTFATIVVFPAWMAAIVIAESAGWKSKVEAPIKPWWTVQGLALITWAYLIWLETMLLVAAGKPGPLSEVGIPLGVLIDYLPIRIALYYVCNGSKWERYTIAAAVLHLLYRIAAA